MVMKGYPANFKLLSLYLEDSVDFFPEIYLPIPDLKTAGVSSMFADTRDEDGPARDVEGPALASSSSTFSFSLSSAS